MNEQAIAVRDPRDPFSQALSLLFKEAKNPRELKEKCRKEMILLVTQVAFKIGAIDTEKSIAERAIPVFAGVISMYLMEQTKGGSDTRVWASEVAMRELKELFRRGFTMLDVFIKHLSPRGKGLLLEHRVVSFVEYLEQYATLSKNGMWIGYQEYTKENALRLEEVTLREFAEWLGKETKAQKHLEPGETLAQFQYAHGSWAVVVTRILLNVFAFGKPSFVMNYQKLKKITDATVAARKEQQWRTRAERHYEAFLATVPERFQQVLKQENKTTEAVGFAFNLLRNFADRRTSHAKSVDYACLAVGIPSPGLSKEAQQVFG